MEDEIENAINFAYEKYFKTHKKERVNSLNELFDINKEYCNYLVKIGKQYLKEKIRNPFTFQESANELEEEIKDLKYETLKNSLNDYLKDFGLLN